MVFTFKSGAKINLNDTELICSFQNQHTQTQRSEVNSIDYQEAFSSNLKPAHLWLTPFAVGTLITFFTPSFSIPYNLGLVLVGIAAIGFVIDILGAMLAQNWSWQIIHAFFSTKYYEVLIRGNQNWEFLFPAELQELKKIQALKASLMTNANESEIYIQEPTKTVSNTTQTPISNKQTLEQQLEIEASLVNDVYLTDKEYLVKGLQPMKPIKGWSLWSSTVGTKQAEKAIAEKAYGLGCNLVYITSHKESFGTTLKGLAYKY